MSGGRYTASSRDGGRFFAGILPSFLQAKEEDRLPDFYKMAHILWSDRFPVPWEWELNPEGEFDPSILEVIVTRETNVRFFFMFAFAI